MQRFLQLCIQHGLAHKMRLHSDVVICHPKNRGSFGIGHMEMQQLLTNIAEEKWHDELFKGICTDIYLPNSSEFKQCIEFNRSVVAGSAGAMAPIEPQSYL